MQTFTHPLWFHRGGTMPAAAKKCVCVCVCVCIRMSRRKNRETKKEMGKIPYSFENAEILKTEV